MTDSGWLKGLWLLVAMSACLSVAAADASITIDDPWVRDAPPHAEMSAAYMTIMNTSGRTRTLATVSSPQFQKVEVHRTQVVNGRVRMLRENSVTVAAHGSLEFKPGVII